MDAIILPLHPIAEDELDSIVDSALAAGLVACNCLTGPFRVSFFKPVRIPGGWARINLDQQGAAA